MKIISGTVIHGEKLGRTIGFPTANIAYSEEDIPDSVFHTNIVINKQIHRGVGTFMKSKKIFEVHIFDFEDDIYGQEIEIILLKKLRDNKKFSSLNEVKQQIILDKETALNQRLNILTFGSFDVIHKGHEYYLSQARKYGTHLISIVATDENILKIKGKAPKNTLLKRAQDILGLEIADEVVAGSETDPLSWIKKYSPHVICLGYDQRGKFVDELPGKLQELHLDTEIIRISAYKPEIYKSSLIKKRSRLLYFF